MQPNLEKGYFTPSLLWKLHISVLICRYKYKYLVQLGENPSVCFHPRYMNLPCECISTLWFSKTKNTVALISFSSSCAIFLQRTVDGPLLLTYSHTPMHSLHFTANFSMWRAKPSKHISLVSEIPGIAEFTYCSQNFKVLILKKQVLSFKTFI